ncbi:MAG: archease [archaeon]|nr:archease [archaeon]
MGSFEFLDHTADIQIHAIGASIEESFEQSVLGMMGVMIDENSEKLTEKISKNVNLSAPDKEILFVDYLTEFLGFFDIEEFLVSRIEIKKIEYNKDKEEYSITSTVYGEKYNPNKHKLDTEVKAVTFSYLRIIEEIGNVEIFFVLDL